MLGSTALRLFTVSLRFLVFADFEPGKGTVVIAGIAGLEPVCLGVIDNRLLIFARLMPRVAAQNVDQGVCRIQPDGFVVVGDRFVVLPCDLPLVSTVIKGLGMGRIDSDRFGVVGDRFGVPAFQTPCLAATVVRAAGWEKLNRFG